MPEKVIVVTGASAGIGAATAELLASQGHSVVLVARRKHFLNALTATFRAEVQETHPGIVFSLVSPGVVRTEFGLKALHGGPDSRELPGSQSAEEVAEVIGSVVERRDPDVCTRQGSRDMVAKYYAEVGADPS